MSELNSSINSSSSPVAGCPDGTASSSMSVLGRLFAARCRGSKVVERIGARFGTGAAGSFLVLGDAVDAESLLAAAGAPPLLREAEGDEALF